MGAKDRQNWEGGQGVPNLERENWLSHWKKLGGQDVKTEQVHVGEFSGMVAWKNVRG